MLVESGGQPDGVGLWDAQHEQARLSGPLAVGSIARAGQIGMAEVVDGRDEPGHTGGVLGRGQHPRPGIAGRDESPVVEPVPLEKPVGRR